MDHLAKYLYKISLFAFLGLSGSLLADETSYSLTDNVGVPLDDKIIQLMNYRNGVYIEVGAHDGINQSNTKRLEEYYGWTGILVEPSENLFLTLCANRPNDKCFQCALGSFEQNNTYVWGDFDGKFMSSVGGVRLNRPATQKTLVRSLQSILDEIGIQHINFFSLDVEGYELNILHGIDFNRTTFDYLLVELYKSEYQDVVSLLLNNGYELVGNFSNYSSNNPNLIVHNDFLFKRK